MASSLKTYLPSLAYILKTTPAALYERQRAMVRAGLLDAQEGRGPGSGVEADPYSVAMLLIAVLVTDSLSEVAAAVAVMKTAPPKGRLCPLTGRVSFIDALAQILATHSSADSMVSIIVDRTNAHATIKSKKGRKLLTSDFYGQSNSEPAALRITAAIDQPNISYIVNSLRQHLEMRNVQ